MEKIKQYKYIILIAILLISFVFYWSEIRPYLVKKTCFEETLPTYYSDQSDNLWLWNKSKSEYDNIYTLCLKKHGI